MAWVEKDTMSELTLTKTGGVDKQRESPLHGVGHVEVNNQPAKGGD